jgi:BirA family biotin operon repressor/biotin-[acetyl-CoA-carboxylase] ligase
VTGRAFLSRQEHFPLVGSTNDVVRGWLTDGTPEVCLAVADEQSAGRGREGRSWQAPEGAALLLSLGFTPAWLPADEAWRLAAITSLAMAEAAEDLADLKPGTIRLKWPNDLIVESDGRPLKLAGVLGETDGLGTDDPRVVVGIGVNADWRATDFPTELAGSMTSLRETGGGRPIDRTRLLEAFTGRLEPRVEALRVGRFDGAGWAGRQATTGRTVTIETRGGSREVVAARDVDPVTGALLVETADGTARSIVSAEIVHVRLGAAEARV